MQHSKFLNSRTDSELAVALIANLETEDESGTFASEIREAIDLFPSISSAVLEFFSEEIELTEVVSEAECETLRLNAEEFKGEVA